MIHLNCKIVEAEPLEDIADRREHFGFDHGRARSDGVDVALAELSKATPRTPVGTPDRLNLISLEVFRQLAAILSDDTRERDGQIIAERQIGLAGRLVLTASEYFENQLVPLFTVLAGERLDVLERRRFEGFK